MLSSYVCGNCKSYVCLLHKQYVVDTIEYLNLFYMPMQNADELL
jgi:hypothetical protein